MDSATIGRDGRQGRSGTNATQTWTSALAHVQGNNEGRRQVVTNQGEYQQGGCGSGPPDVPGQRRLIKIKCRSLGPTGQCQRESTPLGGALRATKGRNMPRCMWVTQRGAKRLEHSGNNEPAGQASTRTKRR